MGKITATDFLIIACVVLSLYSWLSGADLSFSSKSLAGNPVSLITAIFVHASLFHLAGNMVFLYVFGSLVEKELGAARLLFAFLLGGIATFILSMPFYPGERMVGASGAIFTLAAITMLTKPMPLSILFFMPAGAAALLFFIYNLFAVWAGVEGNVAFASHVIGFLIGAGLGMTWSRNWRQNLATAIIALVAYVVILNLLAGFLLG